MGQEWQKQSLRMAIPLVVYRWLQKEVGDLPVQVRFNEMHKV